MRASSSASPSATTPTGQSRARALFERKTPEERSAKRAAIAAAHPINPVVQLDKYGPTLYLHGMSYEDKSVLHKSYVNEHGHIMKDEPYVTYQGSKNDGQNNYPHYPLSACKIDAYVPKMPVTMACSMPLTQLRCAKEEVAPQRLQTLGRQSEGRVANSSRAALGG